ncbi:MAG: DMT family transporter, partial [Gammaproteobacteria bacterium]|nr:DMT family transporter [Gammaproteobacteria bacterium]
MQQLSAVYKNMHIAREELMSRIWQKLHHNVPLIFAAVTTLVFWAGAFVAITIAAREVSPIPLALFRTGVAAIVVLALIPVLAKGKLDIPTRRDLPGFMLMAFLGFPV